MKRLVGITIIGAALGLPTAANAEPGDIVGVEINTDGNPFGYWEYLPNGYSTIGEPWPVFIFLSGIGENGDGTLPPGGCSGPAHSGNYLCRNLRHGPQSHIWNHLYGDGSLLPWDDEERPFIVISPQNHLPGSFTNPYGTAELEAFFDYMVDHYNIDERRMYLTGMSMGGRSVSFHMVDFPGRFAAAALLPGTGATGNDPCLVGRTALWAFHGENDFAGNGTFDPAQLAAWVDGVANCPAPHPVAQLTMYQGQGHNVWARTINLQAMMDPALDTFTYGGGTVVDTIPFAPDLYTWLLEFDLPDVYAGPDITVTEDEMSFDLTAQVEDDDPVAFTWTQTAGPALTLTNDDTATVTVSNLAVGTYTFRVFALDADNQYDEDFVSVEVVEGPPPDETSSSSSSTGGDETTGDTEGSTGSTSTDGSSSTSAASTTSGSDTDSTSGGDDTGPTSGGASTSGSASASGSDSGQTSASTASDTTTPGGDSSGGDTDGTGGANGGGGCSTGGPTSGAPLWMLGLLGLAIRRRREG